MKKVTDYIRNFFRDERGGAELVAIALVLIFVILYAAPKVKTLGTTVGNGIDQTNVQLTQQLGQ